MPVWRAFSSSERGMLPDDMERLMTQYLRELSDFIPVLLTSMVRRIIKLFVRSSTAKVEADVTNAIRRRTEVLGSIFEGPVNNVKTFSERVWKRLDTNLDGVVDRQEFLTGFLNTKELLDLGNAIHSSLADGITQEVMKRLNLHVKNPPGRCGLANKGNTCYLNAAIQCLSATPRFRQLILSDSFRGKINKRNTLGTGGKLVGAFSDLLKTMWSGCSVYTPTEFKRVLGQWRAQFGEYDQQDAQEFFSCFLDGLHEDLNEAVPTTYVELPDNDNMPDTEAADVRWQNHLSHNSSCVQRYFHGQLKSSVRCLKCNHVSIAFDPFSVLSVPVPTTHRIATLDSCLEALASQEDSSWTCSKCKHDRAHLSMLLWRLPKYLVVQLKRYNNETTEKITIPVHFPDVFDPSPWVASSPPPPTAAIPNGAEHSRVESIASMASSIEDGIGCYGTVYQLYAVVNHYGSSRSGHYTAYTKCANEWMLFDDSTVTRLSEARHPCKIATESCYMLFYQLKLAPP
eukprot:Sspe_Gene.37865::Locus_18267_Transcript_1_1_Confidence_1.000_Length_2132::g.37865::m.37865/K11839/USP8, UBP5; ubiquitin carboxyl-terminal hydrolase 8